MEAISKLLSMRNMGQSSEPRRTPREKAEYQAQTYNDMEGNLNAADGYNCKICKNKGRIMRAYEPYPDVWNVIGRDCKCMHIRKSILNMKTSGLKNVISDYTFDRFTTSNDWQAALKDTAMSYAAQPKGWFFVGGQSGAGKTHLCTAICRQLLLDGHEVHYMPWRDEIVKLKSYANKADAYEELINCYKQAEVLYIDDLFKTGKIDGVYQRPTAADINIAFEIINFRYNDPKLLTIISSECTMGDILDVDEAIGGRIHEKAKVISIRPDRNKNFRLTSQMEL